MEHRWRCLYTLNYLRSNSMCQLNRPPGFSLSLAGWRDQNRTDIAELTHNIPTNNNRWCPSQIHCASRPRKTLSHTICVRNEIQQQQEKVKENIKSQIYRMVLDECAEVDQEEEEEEVRGRNELNGPSATRCLRKVITDQRSLCYREWSFYISQIYLASARERETPQKMRTIRDLNWGLCGEHLIDGAFWMDKEKPQPSNSENSYLCMVSGWCGKVQRPEEMFLRTLNIKGSIAVCLCERCFKLCAIAWNIAISCGCNWEGPFRIYYVRDLIFTKKIISGHFVSKILLGSCGLVMRISL